MDGDFAPHTSISWQGNVGTVEYGGGDRGMVCMFYNRAVHNAAKSKEEGRQVFEDKVYVRIHPPGERLNIVDREANENDTRRWPAQWQQFSKNKAQQPDGTPIELLYPDYPSVAAMLRANGIATVEQCAELSAHAIENIGMGTQRYVNAAQVYLKASSKGVAATQMRAQLEERDREIRTLNHKVDSLMAEVENLRAHATMPPDLAQLQAAIAGAMQRPVHMPSRGFDPQTALINANSPTAQVAKANTRRRPRLD